MTPLKPSVVSVPQDLRLARLTLAQIRRIDDMLVALPDYGEVRLIIQRGELRYINKVESFKAGESSPHIHE